MTEEQSTITTQTPYKKPASRGLGVALMGAGVISSFLGDKMDTYAITLAISGGASYIASYISECTYYMKQIVENRRNTPNTPNSGHGGLENITNE